VSRQRRGEDFFIAGGEAKALHFHHLVVDTAIGGEQTIFLILVYYLL
jgi:hypothetical protein